MNRSDSQINRKRKDHLARKRSFARSAVHKALLGAVLATAVFLTGDGYQDDPLDYLLRLASLGANVSSIFVQLTADTDQGSNAENAT